jgi:hypothetical protein
MQRSPAAAMISRSSSLAATREISWLLLRVPSRKAGRCSIVYSA